MPATAVVAVCCLAMTKSLHRIFYLLSIGKCIIEFLGKWLFIHLCQTSQQHQAAVRGIPLLAFVLVLISPEFISHICAQSTLN
jgi:hypothetical protein